MYYVPMLGENAVGDAHDVCRDPVRRPAMTRESSVDDYEIAFGHNHTRLVPERRRNAFYKIEQTLAARLNVRTVLDIVR